MSPEAIVNGLFGSFAVAFGLVIGSFLNVCIARWPDDRSVVTPGSHCPVCNHPVRARDLVPVASWLLLRGRCRDCATPISVRYPLVEALTGLLALLLYRRFIPDPAYLDAPHTAAWAVYLGFISLLVVATYVDLEHRIIPDQTSIYAAPFGLLAAGALTWLGYDGWLAVTPANAALGSVGAALLFGSLSIMAMFVLGHDGLGWGDVKLVAMVGAFLGGIPATVMVVLMSSILASVIGIVHLLWTRRRAYLPFGPALAACAAVYVLYGDWLLKTFLPGAASHAGL